MVCVTANTLEAWIAWGVSSGASTWLFEKEISLTFDFFAVVTVNDYLAQRDAEWMGRVHRFLGLSVGLIQVIFLCRW